MDVSINGVEKYEVNFLTTFQFLASPSRGLLENVAFFKISRLLQLGARYIVLCAWRDCYLVKIP
jgi:hypothetical protein